MHSVQGEAAVWGKLLTNLANAVCSYPYDHQLRIRYRLPMPVNYVTYRWMLLHGGPPQVVDCLSQERREWIVFFNVAVLFRRSVLWSLSGRGWT